MSDTLVKVEIPRELAAEPAATPTASPAPAETKQVPEIFHSPDTTPAAISAQVKQVREMIGIEPEPEPQPRNANWKPGMPYFQSPTPIRDTLARQGRLEKPKASPAAQLEIVPMPPAPEAPATPSSLTEINALHAE